MYDWLMNSFKVKADKSDLQCCKELLKVMYDVESESNCTIKTSGKNVFLSKYVESDILFTAISKLNI